MRTHESLDEPDEPVVDFALVPLARSTATTTTHRTGEAADGPPVPPALAPDSTAPVPADHSATKPSHPGPEIAAARNSPRPPAQRGWRRWVHRATGGRVHPGPSAAEQARRQRHVRIARPLPAGQVVAVLSRKGGVGTTTTTVLLGQTLAQVRPSPVVAVDGHPDQGTLAQRTAGACPWSIRDAAAMALHDPAPSVSALDTVLAHDTSRLAVLGSPPNPQRCEPLDVDQLHRAVGLLQQHYPLLLLEIGPDTTHPVAEAALELATSAVVVGATSRDQARAVIDTVTHLRARRLERLADTATVALHTSSAGGQSPAEVQRHLHGLARHVVCLPRDAHVATGGEISPPDLSSPMRTAALDLADAVVGVLATEGDPQ